MSLTPEIIQDLVDQLGAKHIMLSYNWGVQDLVRTTYEYIESRGIPVWMDIKGGVSGNINAAMAKGVEGAMVICPFMTEDYENSESCELELNYAKDRKVQIVPCMVQEQSKDGSQYRASGWLGVITAGKLWTDFRDLTDDGPMIAKQADQLLLEVANKLNVDTRGGFKPVKPPPKAAAPAAPKKSPPAGQPQGSKSIRLLLSGRKMSIKGHHGMYVGATSKGGVTCKEKNIGAEQTIELVGIKQNVVAFKSKFGKYLSAQGNGTLQWNRDKALGWEHFVVTKIDSNKFTIRSHHGKWLSAQPDGNLQANRDAAQAWEHFTVDTVNTSPPTSPPSGGKPTEKAKAAPKGLKNLALKRTTVYQSSVAHNGQPQRAVDGNTDGVYGHHGVTHTDCNKDKIIAWWHVHLGGWYKIQTVKVWNRVECAERLDKAHVYLHKKFIGSVDFKQGQQTYEFSGSDYSTNGVTVCLIGAKSILSLAQVEVFGTGETGPTLTNVSLKKSCFQSSTAHGGDPNRAVNGKEDNLYGSGNTTHTDPAKDGSRAWWYVDLGARFRINDINILNRAECAERIEGAQIFLDAELIYTIGYTPGVWWYNVPVPGVKHASRIGITLNTGQPLSVCEVMAMSDGTTQ